ncbi:MAG TPA: alpha/beta hydrolase [Microthrixaceae bacterium]|nr:alpha/beta hydrolase [Microthrixaceae bacterium]
MARAATFEVDGLAVTRFAPDVAAVAPDAAAQSTVTTEAGRTVVIVHGTMDRSSGFRRTARALPELDVVLYDRRGYAGSSDAGLSVTIADQVDDLAAVIEAVADRSVGPVVAIGHSLGALICLHLGLARPDLVSAVGAWEPPVPWFDWYAGSVGEKARALAATEDPGEAAELFMRSMITDRLWDRMPSAMKAERRAEGPALLADLELARQADAEVEFAAMTVPVVAGNGSLSAERFRRSAAVVMAEVPDGLLVEVAEAEHGVHLSHPAEFAAFVRATVACGPHR